jgi:hypothetical protein
MRKRQRDSREQERPAKEKENDRNSIMIDLTFVSISPHKSASLMTIDEL